MALAGVVVTAFTLRLAVSGVSPVLGRITQDLHLSPAEAGLLAMMPSLGFALTGILTTLAMRRVGLEALLMVSCGLAALGTLARAASPGDVGFVVLTFVIMCGLGMGNVVLPPVIKKYFPHRIAALSAIYSMLLGMSTATAPFFAVPLADAAGWRVSVGSWAVFSLAALVPWLVLWVGARRRTQPPAEQTPDLTVLPDAVVAPASTARVKPWHSRIGWGVVLMFTGTSANTFSMFLWLPRFLTDTGFSEHEAGFMLSYYAILAVPVSFAVPFLVRRFGNTVVLGLSTVVLYALGYLAVLLWPHATWGGLPPGLGVDHGVRPGAGVLPAGHHADQRPHAHHRGRRLALRLRPGPRLPGRLAGAAGLRSAVRRHRVLVAVLRLPVAHARGARRGHPHDRTPPVHGGRRRTVTLRASLAVPALPGRSAATASGGVVDRHPGGTPRGVCGGLGA